MPIGYLITMGLVAAAMLMALAPLRRSGGLGTLSWFLEALDAPAAWAAVGLGCVSFAAAPVLVMRSLRARAAVDGALDEGLRRGWRAAIELAPARHGRRRLPWGRILLAPLPLLSLGVQRIANLSYGPHGRRNRLDVYRRRSLASPAPILIHLHGGYSERDARASTPGPCSTNSPGKAGYASAPTTGCAPARRSPPSWSTSRIRDHQHDPEAPWGRFVVH